MSILFFAKLVAVLLLIGCTTTQNKPEALDTKMQVKGSVDKEKVGLNQEGEVILQSEVDASDELRTQQWLNHRHEDDIKREYLELKQCRTDLADPRLGGKGSVDQIPQIDDLKSTDEIKEKFGIDDDGNLKLVKKEYFLERLNRERKYEKTLVSMKKVVTDYNESCQQKMGESRLQQGLPARRYDAKGYFTSDGAWIGIEKAERNLDDAFERAAKAKKKHSDNVRKNPETEDGETM
jgi:hypothetical protein